VCALTDICNVLESGHTAWGWTLEAPSDIAELKELVQTVIAQDKGISSANPHKLASYIDRDTVFVDLSRLSSVREHVVSDLVIGVESGITLSELGRLLKERGQFFAASDDMGKLADLLRLGDGGPFESGYGYLRSNVLGFEFFDSHGSLIKCGGRVVKNVTGYDTTKLLVGSSAFGLPAFAFLRLFALPQKTVSLIVSGQELSALLQFSHKLIISALPFSALEITETNARDGYLLSLVFSGASNMVDDLIEAARSLAEDAGFVLSEGELPVKTSASFGRVELALSISLLKRISSGFCDKLGQVSIRPSQGRLTIDCESAEQLQSSSAAVKKLLLADLQDKSIKATAMESYSYSVRVDGVLLDTVELASPGAMRTELLSNLAQGLASPAYHPFRSGLFA